MTTPPPDFWPKVRPSGLSTSTSICFEAPAVLAVMLSPLLSMVELPLLPSPTNECEAALLASWSERPWKEVFWTNNSQKSKDPLVNSNCVNHQTVCICLNTWEWRGVSVLECVIWELFMEWFLVVKVAEQEEEPATTADMVTYCKLCG